MIRYKVAPLAISSEVTTDIGLLDVTVNVRGELKATPLKRIMIHPEDASISKFIPNFFSYVYDNGTFNNTQARITNDGGLTWIIVNIPTSKFTNPIELEAVFTDVTNNLGWLLDPYDPAIVIRANLTTGKIFIVLDSTKLLIGTQIGIDLTLNNGDLAYTLGFNTLTSTYIVDGYYDSTLTPHFDVQGLRYFITTDLSNLRMINGVNRPLLMSFPVDSNPDTAETTYTNRENTLLSYGGSRGDITNFNVSVRTYTNKQMVFLRGSRLVVNFAILEELKLVD